MLTLTCVRSRVLPENLVFPNKQDGNERLHNLLHNVALLEGGKGFSPHFRRNVMTSSHLLTLLPTSSPAMSDDLFQPFPIAARIHRITLVMQFLCYSENFLLFEEDLPVPTISLSLQQSLGFFNSYLS